MGETESPEPDPKTKRFSAPVLVRPSTAAALDGRCSPGLEDDAAATRPAIWPRRASTSGFEKSCPRRCGLASAASTVKPTDHRPLEPASLPLLPRDPRASPGVGIPSVLTAETAQGSTFAAQRSGTRVNNS